jgi:glycerol kinase
MYHVSRLWEVARERTESERQVHLALVERGVEALVGCLQDRVLENMMAAARKDLAVEAVGGVFLNLDTWFGFDGTEFKVVRTEVTNGAMTQLVDLGYTIQRNYDRSFPSILASVTVSGWVK